MNPILKTLIGIGIIAILVFLFIFSYMINKRQPKPEGCQSLEENCEGCSVTTCLNRKEKNDNEGEKND